MVILAPGVLGLLDLAQDVTGKVSYITGSCPAEDPLARSWSTEKHPERSLPVAARL